MKFLGGFVLVTMVAGFASAKTICESRITRVEISGNHAHESKYGTDLEPIADDGYPGKAFESSQISIRMLSEDVISVMDLTTGESQSLVSCHESK